MKKSLIGLGVVAAMAVGGAANAAVTGAFSITGGEGYAGPTLVGSFNGVIDAGSGSSAGIADLGALSAAGINTLAGGTANAVRSALGLGDASNNGTLVYFGLQNGPNGLGYFGILFIGSGNNFALDIDNAIPPSTGVYHDTASGTHTMDGTTYRFSAQGQQGIAAGASYLWLFTELPGGAQLGGDAEARDGNYTVRYMSYTGGAWTTAGSIAGVATSYMNVATFIIPVPAPALLAGLGLAGALALRRRMK